MKNHNEKFDVLDSIIENVAPRTDIEANKAFDKHLELLNTANERRGEDVLKKSCYDLGRFIGAKRLDEDKVRVAITEAAKVAGIEADKAKSLIEKQLEAGKNQPKILEVKEEEVKESKTTCADELMNIAIENTKLFRDALEKGYAQVLSNGRTQVFNLKSSTFRAFLTTEYYKKTGMVASTRGACDSVVDTLEGLTLSLPISETYNRIAYHNENLYYDLGDETGRCVQITKNGWEIIETSPVLFVRPKGSLAQAEPVRGGNIQDLRKIVNIREEDFVLIVSWLMSFFLPEGAFPHLILRSEKGTAKTTTQNNLRSLLDPNVLPSRKAMKNLENFFIAAGKNAVMSIENISHISKDFSDSLCLLSTGSGDVHRTFYENDEETLFKAKSPAVLSAINDVVTETDLLDRILLVHLPLLTEKERKTDSEVSKQYAKLAPELLGVLLDAVSVGLKNLPETKLEGLPRLANFTIWAYACLPELGFDADEFIETYAQNRKEAEQIPTKDSSFAISFKEWADGLDKCLVNKKGKEMRNENGEPLVFQDSTSELLFSIANKADFGFGQSQTRPPKDWPQHATAAGKLLKKFSSAFRQMGFDIQEKTITGKAVIRVYKVDREPVEVNESEEIQKRKDVEITDFDHQNSVEKSNG